MKKPCTIENLKEYLLTRKSLTKNQIMRNKRYLNKECYSVFEKKEIENKIRRLEIELDLIIEMLDRILHGIRIDDV